MRSIVLVLVLAAGLACASPALAQQAPPSPAGGPVRYEADKLRSAMMSLVPPRLVVAAVSVEDDRGRVSGTAKTQAQVSDFLRAIDRAGDFQRAELLNIRMDGGEFAFDIGLQIACVHGPAKSGPRLCNPPPSKAGTVHRCKVNGTLTFQATPCAPGQEG